jgi:flavin-dependent dehydrogenase
VDRGEFDRFLAKRYSGEIALGKAIIGAKKAVNGWELHHKSGSVESKRVVLATGYDTTLHKFFGLKGPSEFIYTSQYEVSGVELDRDFVELYVGSVAPGFFGWLIPTGESTARIGIGVLGAEKPVHSYMEGFLKRLKKEGRFRETNKVIHKSGGLIPVFEPGLELAKSGAYLVGDAAGQVKLTTGGGVMIGGLAAKALARCIHTNTDYEDAIADLDKELRNHLMIRKILNKFGDEQYEHMIEFLNKPDIKKIIEEKGDMDFVGPLMEHVMKNPLMMMQALKFLGRGVMF